MDTWLIDYVDWDYVIFVDVPPAAPYESSDDNNWDDDGDDDDATKSTLML